MVSDFVPSVKYYNGFCLVVFFTLSQTLIQVNESDARPNPKQHVFNIVFVVLFK